MPPTRTPLRPDGMLLCSATLDGAENRVGALDCVVKRHVLSMDLETGHDLQQTTPPRAEEDGVESDGECAVRGRGARQTGFEAAQAHQCGARPVLKISLRAAGAAKLWTPGSAEENCGSAHVETAFAAFECIGEPRRNGVAAENRASSLDAHAIENGSSSETRKETDAFFAKGDA